MTVGDAVAAQLAQVDTARSETAVFVRMDGPLAVVNIGPSTVRVPCVGFFPPVSGMPVRVDWINGSASLVGPVKPLSPLGTITGTGTPKATVTVDGTVYQLFYRSGYTPTVGDTVEINWATGIIQGQVTGFDAPEPPPVGGGSATPFDVTVRAVDSGRYQSGSGWWGNGPWASDNNSGIWVYGNTIADAIGSGTVTAVSVYLPLTQELGNCAIGTHPHASIPGGAPSIGSTIDLPLGGRAGWVGLPAGFGSYLAAGERGLGVLAPGAGGYNIWNGTASDSMSGAVRLIGSR